MFDDTKNEYSDIEDLPGIDGPIPINPVKNKRGLIIADNGRQCTKCPDNTFKLWEEFGNLKRGDHGHNPMCKVCQSKQMKKWHNDNPSGKAPPREITDEGRRCTGPCKQFKPWTEFSYHENGINEKTPECTECLIKRTQAWHKAHPEHTQTAEYKAKSKISRDKYRSTEKGKATTKRCSKEYNQSEHGKAVHKAYYSSDKYLKWKAKYLKQKSEEYRNSPEIRANQKAYNKWYKKNFPEKHAETKRKAAEKFHTNRPEVDDAWELTEWLFKICLLPIRHICCVPGCKKTALEHHHRNHHLPHEILYACNLHHNQLNNREIAVQDGVEYGEDWLYEVYQVTIPYVYGKTTPQVAWNVTRKMFAKINKKLPKGISSRYIDLSPENQIDEFQRMFASAYLLHLRQLGKILWSGCVITGDMYNLELHHDQGYETPKDKMTVIELRKDIHSEITQNFNNSITKYLKHYRLDAKSEFKRAK